MEGKDTNVTTKAMTAEELDFILDGKDFWA